MTAYKISGMLKIVRWGIIGCGSVTEVKSGPAFQKTIGSELVAVMRRNGRLARDYAMRHGVPKWYDNAAALINDQDVDAVYIATPPSSHREYALMAARAGKSVYVEKPMALNYQECQEMINACEEAGVPLYVAYYRRALPKFLKIKSLIEEGLIGKIHGVNLRFYQEQSINDQKGVKNWRVEPEIAGGGYFVDLGSHMIDILQYFLGDITSAAGHTRNQGRLYEAEDIVGAVFTFNSGVEGVGLWSFSAGENLDRTEIIGSEGTIIYSTFASAPVLVRKGDKAEEYDIPNPQHIEQPLIQIIVNELLGTGKSPSTGRTGARASWVMDKILGKLQPGI